MVLKRNGCAIVFSCLPMRLTTDGRHIHRTVDTGLCQTCSTFGLGSIPFSESHRSSVLVILSSPQVSRHTGRKQALLARLLTGASRPGLWSHSHAPRCTGPRSILGSEPGSVHLFLPSGYYYDLDDSYDESDEEEVRAHLRCVAEQPPLKLDTSSEVTSPSQLLHALGWLGW